jgi:beta-lactamase regulating signal transducer with metallopeptidase domain
MTAVSIALKATVLLAVAGLLHAFLRGRGSAAARHLLWTSALTALLALPFAEAVLPHWTIAIPVAGSAAAPVAADTAGFAAVEAPGTTAAAERAAGPAPERAFARQAPAVPILIYAMGLLLLIARLVRESMTLHRVAAASREVDDEGWRRLLDRASADLRIAGRVRLLRTANEIVPITFGTLRPAVMIPASADSWSDDRRRAVLLHELAHVARRDCLAQLAGAVACAVYWPHPGVWWAARRLRVERELACDDRVIAAGAEPHAYAGHLLELARSLGAAPAPATALAMARVGDLETRLRAVVDAARNRAALPRRGSAAVIAVSIAIVLPIAALRGAVTERGTLAQPLRAAGASTALRSIVAAVQGASDLSGTWEVRLSADGATAHLTVRTAHSSHGETLPTAQLESLAGARIAGAGGPVHFSIRRDAGTFVGDGTCRAGVCAGTATFEPDPAFGSELAKRGIGMASPHLSNSDALQMAIHDVGFEFLDQIARDGYAKPDIQGLVRAAQHGVGLTYVRDMTTLGYRLGTLDALVGLRDHGVDPAYVRGMAANGMVKLSADDLVRARDHGIDPAYVEGMRALGFSLSLDGLVAARDHGIDPQYARGMRQSGYPLSLAELRTARDHGIDPDYVAGLAALGYKGLTLAGLVGLRDHGVDPDYARGLAALGYKNLSLDTLINLRGHGVDPAYVRGLADLGYSGLPLDTLLRLRDHGVDPAYVRRLREKGMTTLTPDQLIDRRDRGLDDPAVAAREMLDALRSAWRSLISSR